jgi:acetoin utilization deacetylase AcuC-like enzyme
VMVPPTARFTGRHGTMSPAHCLSIQTHATMHLKIHMGRTGFVYHSDYLNHDMGSGHPESPERLWAILKQLTASRVLARLQRIEPRAASDDWIMQVHAASYISALKIRAPSRGRVALDPDTSMSEGSLPAAYLAVGGALAAADAIVSGEIEHAFCAVRPPGHHAEHDRAMGFCLFNNVAIAARYVQQQHHLERVLIIDWDVHHGNGTQHTFYQDPSILFFSTHQYPYYPGSGRASERGEGRGEGTTINVPLTAGQSDEDYREVFEQVLVPAAETFKPEFILISAGFDAHKDDPLAGMGLTEDGYAALTGVVARMARRHCNGRILSCLEGGYNLTALAASVERHLIALLEA